MNDDLKIILNSLKHPNVNSIDLLGCYGVLIHSKSIFNSNKELSEFLEEIFDDKLPLYVTKSRALMAARILKQIFICKDDENKIKNITKKTFNKLNDLMEKDESNKNIGGKKQRNENENQKLEKWLKGM